MPASVHPEGPSEEVKPQVSGLAITALVLGSLGFVSCGITAVVGFILGDIAHRQIKSSNGWRTGSGLAIGGIVTSSVACLLFLIILFTPPSPTRRRIAQYHQNACLSHQQQIAASILMYNQDHDETLPRKETWNADLAATYGVAGKVWDCPETSNRGTEAAPEYGYNALLSGKAFGDLSDPRTLLLTADVTSGKLLNTKSDIATTRHRDGFCAGFLDGHVTWQQAATPVRLKP
ncbi:MAG TPA: DUF4190 domain-containing protein [Armatimonadota bacterium]